MISPQRDTQPSLDFSFLEKVARDLPIIRPIKEFIHLNLLLSYQHLPFWEALNEVSRKLEAMPLPDLDFYRERMAMGELPWSQIEKRLALVTSERQDLIRAFIKDSDFRFTHHDVRVGALHDQWNRQLQTNVIQLADGMLIKWLGMFMDQGISHWQMPGSDSLSFYDCVRTLIADSLIRPFPFNRRPLEDFFSSTAEEAIARHLHFLCPNPELQETYCAEAVTTLRGWAGLIFSLQKNPELLSFRRQITLVDFLAVKLLLERAWIQGECPDIPAPVLQDDGKADPHPFDNPALFEAHRICQEALEEATYEKVLRSIQEKSPLIKSPSLYQAVFCMDDRECGLRRHLEASGPGVETFGTAGHFGIECFYQHESDPFPKKQCPAPVPAKYLLKDVAREGHEIEGSEDLRHHLIQPSSNLMTDWVLLFADALSSFFKLSRNLFFPLAGKDLRNVREIYPETELKLFRDNVLVMEKELKEGYTSEEMAQVVYQQLLLMGFVHDFAPLVFFIGHGSHSENNPYFTSYGCGACSGRTGSANARALAQMANRKDVRELILKNFGLRIPSGTSFVGGLHDTCQDIVELYETAKLSDDHKKLLPVFKKRLSLALSKHARERSRSFRLVTYARRGKRAQKEVLRRAHSLFETRPELGHTNVAFAIVGRRDLTRGLDLGRRSFLQSYDHTVDPEGKLLAQVLGAVIPVCSGINLDYFFSRVDNQRFGAGSKLPHNIVGNIGVSHGTESDLLFGLPFQMIDQHKPVRLLVLVEQSPEIALKAIQGNALVRQIVSHGWIHYASLDPVDNSISFFKDGLMVLSPKGELP